MGAFLGNSSKRPPTTAGWQPAVVQAWLSAEAKSLADLCAQQWAFYFFGHDEQQAHFLGGFDGEAPVASDAPPASLPFLEVLSGDAVRIKISDPFQYPLLAGVLSGSGDYSYWAYPIYGAGVFVLFRLAPRVAAQAATLKARLDELELRFLRYYFYTKQAANSGVLAAGQGPAELFAFLGNSPEVRRVADYLGQVVLFGLTEPLLIQGEFGLGKSELVKRIGAMVRPGESWYRVDCAALQNEYLEREVFGWARGRLRATRGRVQQLGRGILHLSELGLAHLGFQERLLGAIQDGFFRDDFGEPVPFRVGLVATSSYNLEGMVEKGRFNADLYRRLAKNSVFIPALRRRPEDIAWLAGQFVTELNERNNIEARLDGDFLAAIQKRPLPGNRAELQARLEFAYYKAIGGQLRLEDFDSEDAASGSLPGEGRDYNLRRAVEKLEQEMILEAYAKCNGNQVQIAKLLGISRGSLQYRLQKLGIKGG